MNDQTVIVTGTLGGIGAATVELLLRDGMTVIGIDKIPDDEKKFSVGSYYHLTADITHEDEVAAACEKVWSLARSPHPIPLPAHALLIAGGALREEIVNNDPLGLSLDVFRRSVDLNLVGQYICIKHFLPLLDPLKAKNPSDTDVPDRSITLISSINSMGDFGYPAYSAAKAGLAGLVKSLTVHLGRRRIRINAVAFGTVRTDHVGKLHAADSGHFKRLENLAAFERVLNSHDAAQVLVSLTKLHSVTGTILPADYGQVVPGNHSR